MKQIETLNAGKVHGMKKQIRLRGPLIGLLILGSATVPNAHAQGYPSRPLQLIVPYGTGGDADLAGRIFGEHVSKYVNHQPVVIVNRPGASGVIGSKMVRNATPDGYTLLLARIGSQAIVPAVDSTTPYRWNDFTFLSVLELNPYLCVVKNDAPYRSMQDLVTAIRQNPGRLNYGSAGPGTIQHFGPLYLFSTLGLKSDAAIHVPYKGGGQALVGLLAGETQFQCQSIAPLVGHLKAGRLRGLLTTTPQRIQDALNVPTARELGYPQLEKLIGWSALYGPPKLPKAVVAKWTAVTKQLAQDADWIKGNATIGSIPGVRSPKDTEEFALEQYELFHGLAKSIGLYK